MTVTTTNEQIDKIRSEPGFIAALDQSGGSTPKALSNYGIGADAFGNDEEMYELIHAMRSRIMTSPAFSGERIMGAILFENTMDREVEGQVHRGLPVGSQTGSSVPESRQGPR